jgi:hypothetical protein
MRRTLLFLAFLAAPLFAHPSVSVVFDSKGNLYYSDLHQVLRLAPDGKLSVAVPGVHSHELAIDAQDNLYGEHLWYEGEKTDKWGYYVWKRAPNGSVSMVIPRSEGFLTNYSFVRDAAGNMYWADRDRGEIRKRAPNGAITTIAREIRKVRWMTSSPRGTLFLIDLPDLVRIEPNGRVTRLARNVSGGMHDVQGLWVDRSENVYLADYAHRQVLRVTPQGRVTVIAKSPFLWAPTGGGIAPNGTLWILETRVGNAVRVRRFGVR